MKYDLSKILNMSLTDEKVLRVFDIIRRDSDVEQFVKNGLVSVPFLKKFFCTDDMGQFPYYWREIQNHPRGKGVFALLSFIFLNDTVIKKFTTDNANGVNGRIFKVESILDETIRMALIKSGSADCSDLESDSFEYDFSAVTLNPVIGAMFRDMLVDRLSPYFPDIKSDTGTLHALCSENKFHMALGMTEESFFDWIDGKPSNGSYIKKIDIENFLCVKERITLNFGDSKEIYLLGDNGSGKTTLLMAAYLAFNGNRIMSLDNGKVGSAQQIFKNFHNLRGYDDKDTPYGERLPSYLQNFFAYGSHRNVSVRQSETDEYGFMSLFDNHHSLSDPLEWMKTITLKSMIMSGDTSVTHIKKDEEVSPICPMESESIIRQIEGLFRAIMDRDMSIVPDFEDMRCFAFEHDGERSSFDGLPESYRSVFILICDMFYQIYGTNPASCGAAKEFKGVIIVDGIEAHLHPIQQRRIVHALRNAFPCIQFIFSTNSPIVIQGASDDAVIYRTYKEDCGIEVSNPYNKRELNHMMLNTLATSPLFGLENARVDSKNDNADTSSSYLVSRIDTRIRKKIKDEKLGTRLTDEIIEKLIEEAMREEENG